MTTTETLATALSAAARCAGVLERAKSCGRTLHTVYALRVSGHGETWCPSIEDAAARAVLAVERGENPTEIRHIEIRDGGAVLDFGPVLVLK